MIRQTLLGVPELLCWLRRLAPVTIQVAFNDSGYPPFTLHGSNSLPGWSLSSKTTVSEKRLGFFRFVVIPLDHLWLVLLTLMGFQRPSGQLALELEKVQVIRWI
jgi:hypothetical protein